MHELGIMTSVVDAVKKSADEAGALRILKVSLSIGEMTEARMAELKPKMKYVINHSKKEYVVIPEDKEGEWIIHPLPLLTADGNGLGGGDYHRGTDMDKVGLWAYDIIEVGDEIPEGYTEFKVDFKEN